MATMVFYIPIYTYTASYTNPIYTINNNQYANVNQYLLTNSSLEATVFTGLKNKTNAGITITNAMVLIFPHLMAV